MDGRLEIATLGYHDVTDDPTTSGFQRPGALPYKLGRRAFRAQLDRIAAGPVAPTLVTAIDWTKPGRHVLLTFDDGGKSALDAAEELSRHGWRGHFFIVTGRIGAPTFLDASEIRWLRGAGHLVGSHSHTHPDIFRDLTAAQMSEEWRVSRDVLGGLLGEACVIASVPGGDISPAVVPRAAAAGLRYLFTSEPWLRPRRVDGCWALGRFAPKVTTAAPRVQRLTEFRGWLRARVLRELSVLARRTAPVAYRWYVQRTTREVGGATAGAPRPVVSPER
jgi:peptidoglycan/xylan/chitin deacetylase (PgdA/CDA1 family)